MALRKAMKTLEEDFADGAVYGFPMCCIGAFCARGGTANARQALDYGIVNNNGNPFVPCHLWHFPDVPLWQQDFFDDD